MSHEIRTPLGVVLGLSELVADALPEKSGKETWVLAIKRNCELLSNIINDILDLSKMEAGKLDIERRNVALSDLLSDMTTVLDLKAREKELTVAIDFEEPVPRIIHTDPLRVKQILINLVGNAIKFTQRGSIRILVSYPAKGRLAFIVTDTGSGIAPERRECLFESFSQTATLTARKVGGTGLGLALTKKLAQALGGDAELTHSELGVGSRFMAFIDPEPVAPAAGCTTEPPPYNGPGEPAKAPNKAPTGIKVLLAEDNDDLRMMLRQQLIGMGVDVALVENGKEALERALANGFDLILMDIQMPVMSGKEAAVELRKLGYEKPIVALSAYAMKDDIVHGLQNGFDAYLTKPIDRNILAETMSRLCKKNSTRPLPRH